MEEAHSILSLFNSLSEHNNGIVLYSIISILAFLAIFERYFNTFKKIFSFISGKLKFSKEETSSNLDDYLLLLKSEIENIENIKTGDLIKDTLLKDVAHFVLEAETESFSEFIENAKKTHKKSEIIKYFSICTSHIVKNYQDKFKQNGIPRKFIEKILGNFSAQEFVLNFGLETFLNNREIQDIKQAGLYYVNSISVCLLRQLSKQISYMNGDLNGIEYKGKIVGMYDSFSNLKIKRFPFPLGIYEPEVSHIIDKVIKNVNADFGLLVDFYEPSFLAENNSLDGKTEEILSSKFAISYSNDENKFPYKDFIGEKINKILDASDVRLLIENKTIFAEVNELPTWSNLKTTMIVLDIKYIIIQPILLNKEKLIGLEVFMYKNKALNVTEKNKYQKYVYSSAPFCVRFLRH
mgnify:CR=1 FL=1